MADAKQLLNIFFCFDKEPDFFSDLEKTIASFKDKFILKGKFNCSNIIHEISYYLGIDDDEIKGEIDNEETQNLLILYTSFNNSKQLLKEFQAKFESEGVNNDDQPFFIFLPNENEANFDAKNLFLSIQNEQKNVKDSYKLDSRNISIENKETILYKIENIFNYFNEIDEDNFEYNNSELNKNATINIMTLGKRGAGKSTFINRILGEKKAYAQKDARTSKEREYYHRNYPLKFIDTAGFEIGKMSEINNANDFLKKNNLNNDQIHKKVHFIFYLFKYNDKFEVKEIEIIKELYSFKINLFFLITFMKKDEEKSSRTEFKKLLKKNKFSKEDIEKIMENTFCLDLLDLNYTKVIYEILNSLIKKLEIYELSNNRIIEDIQNYYYLIKTEDNSYQFKNVNNLDNGETGETEIEDNNLALSQEDSKEGIITPFAPKDPNDVISVIKNEIKDNIFFLDFENDRDKKKKLAQKIVESYQTPGFWWSTIPIPFLNEHLARKSKEKMVKEISEIYNIVIKKKLKDLNFQEKNKFWVGFIFKIGGVVAGIWNKERVYKLGEKIIAELDAEYSKLNILEIYKDMAENLNKNFLILKKFPSMFNTDLWYDINFEK